MNESLRLLSFTVKPCFTQNKKSDQIGYIAADGTIFCGRNKNGMYLYAPPSDIANGNATWFQAKERIKRINKLKSLHGHKDWDLPTGKGSQTDELKNNFFDNKEEIGGFNLSGSDAARRYWSNQEHEILGASYQYFDNGIQYDGYKFAESSVRPVRRVVRLII